MAWQCTCGNSNEDEISTCDCGMSKYKAAQEMRKVRQKKQSSHSFWKKLVVVIISSILAYSTHTLYANYLDNSYKEKIKVHLEKGMEELFEGIYGLVPGLDSTNESSQGSAAFDYEKATESIQAARKERDRAIQLSAKEWRDKNRLLLAISDFYLLPAIVFIASILIISALFKKYGNRQDS